MSVIKAATRVPGRTWRMRPVAASLVLAAAAAGCGGRSELPIPDRVIDCEGTDAVYSKIGQDVRVSDSYGLFPSHAKADKGYGVSWDSDGVYFKGISENWEPIGHDVRISDLNPDPDCFSLMPSLVWNGNDKEFGVSWLAYCKNNWEIRFKPVSEDGVPIGTDVIIMKNVDSISYPSLVPTANGYAAVWAEDRKGNPEVYFIQFSKNGELIGSDVRISSNIDNPISIYIKTNLVFTGSEFAAFWDNIRNDKSNIYSQPISINGIPIGQDVPITNDIIGDSFGPSFVWNGSGYAGCWSSKVENNWEINFRFVSKIGAPINPVIPITNDVTDSIHPSVVRTNHGYAVIWEDRDGKIKLKRISNDGLPIGPDVQVSDVAGSGWWHSSFVWAGNYQFGVCWGDSRDGGLSKIYCARIGCEL